MRFLFLFKIMTVLQLSEFNSMSKDLKCQYLWAFGQYLMSRRENGMLYGLYYVDDFYAEIGLLNEDIVEVKAFKEGLILNRYLDQIDISEFA